MNAADRRLLNRLRRMFEERDPMPAGLIERVLFSLQLESLDVELLPSLLSQEAGVELAAARADDVEDVRTVTFGSERVTLMLTLSAAEGSGHRVDGWIVPVGPLPVEVRLAGGTRTTVADDTGRFAFDDIPSGLVQFVLHPCEGGVPDLAKPVVTPAIKL